MVVVREARHNCHRIISIPSGSRQASRRYMGARAVMTRIKPRILLSMLLAVALPRPALQVSRKAPCRATLVTRNPRRSRFIIPRQPRPIRPPSATGSSGARPPPPPLPPDTVSSALRDANSEDNNLLSPVHIPEDPDGILKERHPAAKILAISAVVIQRELEMMNIMLGFEQANKYVIMDPQGNHLGYMAEQEFGMGNIMARQWFRTHRSFTTHVFDKQMKEVLRVRAYAMETERLC